MVVRLLQDGYNQLMMADKNHAINGCELERRPIWKLHTIYETESCEKQDGNPKHGNHGLQNARGLST